MSYNITMAMFLRQQQPQSELSAKIAKRLKQNSQGGRRPDGSTPPNSETYDQADWKATSPAGFWLVIVGLAVLAGLALLLL